MWTRSLSPPTSTRPSRSIPTGPSATPEVGGAVHLRAVIAVALALALVATLFDLPRRPIEAAARKPDIVLFYIDDFAP